MWFIALFAVVVINLSAHTDRAFEAAEGFSAPQFQLTHYGDSTAISLADMKGRFTLVNFWSSEEPQSRIAANEYNSFAKTANPQQFSLIGVNLDATAALFRETVKRDRLNEATQYRVAGPEAGRLADAYNLRHGLRSFLVDPAGKIIAVNPSRATLHAILNR